MIRTTLWVTAMLICYILLAKTTVNFKPFKIQFDAPYYAIGFFLITVGILFIQYQSKLDGIKQCVETTIEAIKQIQEEEKIPN